LTSQFEVIGVLFKCQLLADKSGLQRFVDSEFLLQQGWGEEFVGVHEQVVVEVLVDVQKEKHGDLSFGPLYCQFSYHEVTYVI